MKTTLLIGVIAPLAGTSAKSAIDKQVVSGPQWIRTTGFEGDETADRRVHGGPEKAIHHYPADHYTAWRADLGDLPILTAPGAFGENICAPDLTEDNVAVGDIFRLGDALLQVSQGRQPCWKLNHRFDVRDMARRVQSTGRTGWYYRILQPGHVRPGDDLAIIDRIAPEWTLRRLWRAMYLDRMNTDELSGIARLDVLADSWRRYAIRRLETGRVEDWKPRLDGSA